MKLKIKIKSDGTYTFPSIIGKGEWIDLYAAKDTELLAPKLNKGNNIMEFSLKLIPLGVRMKLPEGFEAIMAPRSSTPKNFGMMQSNSIGIIDNSYSGNDDEWKFAAFPLKNTVVKQGDKICQFRIQLSQKATVWQKFKWLLCSGVKLVRVDDLGSKNRGGFGSTGKNKNE